MKCELKEIKKITLYNNYDFDFESMKADYAESTDQSIDDVKDEQVWDYISMIDQDNWDYAENVIEKCVGSYNYKWIVVGHAGGWLGTREACRIFDNADNMIQAIVENCDYVKVEYTKSGHMYITATHHDGTNSFECKLLTPKGFQVYEDWAYGDDDKNVSEYQKVNNLFNCSIYSVLPHLEKLA